MKVSVTTEAPGPKENHKWGVHDYNEIRGIISGFELYGSYLIIPAKRLKGDAVLPPTKTKKAEETRIIVSLLQCAPDKASSPLASYAGSLTSKIKGRY